MNEFSEHLGKFKISWKVIKEYPDVVFAVFNECIPIKAISDKNGVEYTAISKQFKLCTSEQTIPLYRAIINTMYKDNEIAGYAVEFQIEK